MDLLKDLKLSLLNFSFVMIYIIDTMLVLLKDHLNFFRLLIFFKILFFFITYNNGKFKS